MLAQEARLLAKKGLPTLDKFRRAPEEKKQVGGFAYRCQCRVPHLASFLRVRVREQKVLSDLSAEEWKHVTTVTNLLPAVKLDYKYEVEDEKGLYEGDIVLLTVSPCVCWARGLLCPA